MQTFPDSDGALERALQRARQDGSEATLRQRVALSRPWRSPADAIHLEADYHISHDTAGPRVTARLGPHTLPLDQPVRLAPVEIDKPWGRELWHTGIEARGESRVVSPAGELPLSQYLALAPRRLCRREPLVLLKVLDPHPHPVTGDLYFEVHREKQEVYVVTHVDPEAWPEGRGGIRYGMNQALRSRYRDDAAFRRDYLASVRAYERVRRVIDEGGAAAGAAAQQEPELRAAMEAFTGLRSLSVGDVIPVPCWLPHSLQHGVRVIEFQTPTYERYIISFAQRVVTQGHWDSEEAVANMRLDAPPPPVFEAVAPGVERIVTFDEFGVWRATLPPGGTLLLPDHASYLVCMGVQGEVRLGALTLAPEQAAFVPAAALENPMRRERDARLVNPAGEPAVLLLASPDL